jgi:hypothetical protein
LPPVADIDSLSNKKGIGGSQWQAAPKTRAFTMEVLDQLSEEGSGERLVGSTAPTTEQPQFTSRKGRRAVS